MTTPLPVNIDTSYADSGTDSTVKLHQQHHDALHLAYNRRPVFHVKDYGALGDTRLVQDGAMTAGSATLTSATASFTAADVGKVVQVARASASNFGLATTIASVTSATAVVLSRPAAFGQTALRVEVDGMRVVNDGVTTADSTTLTSATAAFTAADVGKHIHVGGIAQGTAGPQAAALNTTISSVTNPTTVVLAATAGRTCSGSQVVLGTNDTTAVQSAITAASNAGGGVVYAPHGTYLISSSVNGTGSVALYSNVTLQGDGWATVFRTIGVATAAAGGAEMFGVNIWNGGDGNVANNQRNVVVRDLQLQGTVVEDGFREGLQLLSLAAASDVLVENVKFTGYRSDGIYINMGSSVATLERHNERIKVLNCTFDGINRDNRNGISVLDCDDLLVDGCTFINSTRQNMPGAIDVEPNTNNVYPVIRGHRFTNNYIYACGGNSGHIGMFLNMPQTRQNTPMRGMSIADNFIAGGVGGQLGFFINQQQYPTETTIRNDIKIERNVVLDCNYVAELEGMKGLQFSNNIVRNCSYSLILGYVYKNLDVEVTGNVFSQVGRIGSYGVEIIQADRTVLSRNVFENIGAADLSQGFVVRLNNGGALYTAPTPTLTAATTGGTLASGTKSYRIASYRDNGNTTLPGTAATIATTGTTSTVTVSWAEDPGAAGYRVYGRTAGSELLIADVTAGTLSYTDTGSVTPAGALPTADTSASGNSNGVMFTGNTIRQGASNRITGIASKTALHTTVSSALRYYDNTVPNNATLAVAPFVDRTTAYTITAATLTVDAALVPPAGTVTIATGATSNTTLTITNPTPGQVLTLAWTVTAASQVYALPSNAKIAGGAWTKSTTAGYVDAGTFRYDGSAWVELSRALAVR